MARGTRFRLAAVLVTACAASACGYQASSAQAGRTAPASTDTKQIIVYIRSAKVPKVGTVLVNAAGRTLYVFAPDKAKRVTCNSGCQSFWPAATLPTHAILKAEGSVKQSLLGTDPNPVSHERVVTYNGWPLYTYLGDSASGQANGQNLNQTGGYWWVMRPNGEILR